MRYLGHLLRRGREEDSLGLAHFLLELLPAVLQLRLLLPRVVALVLEGVSRLAHVHQCGLDLRERDLTILDLRLLLLNLVLVVLNRLACTASLRALSNTHTCKDDG